MDLFLKVYKPKMIAGNIYDKCIKHRSGGDEQQSIEGYLENIKPYLQ